MYSEPKGADLVQAVLRFDLLNLPGSYGWASEWRLQQPEDPLSPADPLALITSTASKLLLLRAKEAFRSQQYDAVIHSLARDRLPADLETSTVPLFLRNYAGYRSGQQFLSPRLGNCALNGVQSDLNLHTARYGPLDGPCLWLLGQVAHDSGRPHEARKLYLAAVRAEPLLWDAWASLCRLLAGAGNPQPSLPFKKLPRDEPAFQEATDKGVSADSPEKFAEQLDLPLHPAAAFAFCEYLFLIGDFRLSLHHFTLLTQHFPRSLFVLLRIARIACRLKAYDVAFQFCARLREIDPGNVHLAEDYAEALQATGQIDVLGAFVAKIRRLPRSPPLLAAEGLHLSACGQFADAAACHQQAVELDPGYVDGWILLGHALAEDRKLDEALKAHREALKKAPKDYRAWFGLGQVQELTGNEEAAAQSYAQAALLHENDWRLWEALGTLLAKADRTEDAYFAFEKAWLLNQTLESSVALFRSALAARRHEEATRMAGIVVTEYLAEAVGREEVESPAAAEAMGIAPADIKTAAIHLMHALANASEIGEAQRIAEVLQSFSGLEAVLGGGRT